MTQPPAEKKHNCRFMPFQKEIEYNDYIFLFYLHMEELYGPLPCNGAAKSWFHIKLSDQALMVIFIERS